MKTEKIQSPPKRVKASSKRHAVDLLKSRGCESANASTVDALTETFPDAMDSHGRITITDEHVAFVKQMVNSAVIPNKETLQCCKLIVEIKKILFATENEQGLHVPKAEHEAWVSDTQSRIKMLLVKVLKSEMPPKLAGLGAVEIAAKMDPLIDELVKLIKFCRQ